MIPLAASASRWLLSGGWKWAGMGMCVLAVLFYRHEAHSWHKAFDSQRAAYVAAGHEATARQIAANLATEARYRAIATEVDTDHAKSLTGAHGAADSFIARNRVQPSGQCAPGGPAAAAQGAGARVPEITTAAPIVVGVESGDVRACTDAATYAQSAHAWATGLIRDGLGE